jgi:hypothetical protein
METAGRRAWGSIGSAEVFAEGTAHTTTKWDVHCTGVARYRQGAATGLSPYKGEQQRPPTPTHTRNSGRAGSKCSNWPGSIRTGDDGGADDGDGEVVDAQGVYTGWRAGARACGAVAQGQCGWKWGAGGPNRRRNTEAAGGHSTSALLKKKRVNPAFSLNYSLAVQVQSNPHAWLPS